jgi:hypothetical protein
MRTFFTLLLVFFVSSCSKSSGDDQAPVIVINTPLANETVAPDAVVTVMATVTDDDEIHEIHLDITKKSTNNVMHYHYHPDVKSFNIDETFTAVAGATYQIKVESDDHSGNKSEKEIEIHCQ